VTGEFTILTLISSRILEKFTTEGTSNDLIELLHNEFVSVDLLDFFLSLTNGTLSTKTTFEGSLAVILFD